MPICAECGQENPEGFRLCGMCGAALTEADGAGREERVGASRYIRRAEALLAGAA